MRGGWSFLWGKTWGACFVKKVPGATAKQNATEDGDGGDRRTVFTSWEKVIGASQFATAQALSGMMADGHVIMLASRSVGNIMKCRGLPHYGFISTLVPTSNSHNPTTDDVRTRYLLLLGNGYPCTVMTCRELLPLLINHLPRNPT